MTAERTEIALHGEVRRPDLRWMEPLELIDSLRQDFPSPEPDLEDEAGQVRWVAVRGPWTPSEAKDEPSSPVRWVKVPRPLARLVVLRPDVGFPSLQPLDPELVGSLEEVRRNLGEKAFDLLRYFVGAEQGNLRPESDPSVLSPEEHRQFVGNIEGLLELPPEELIAKAIGNTNLRDSKDIKDFTDKVVAWVTALFSVAVALEIEGTSTPWPKKLQEILELLSLIDDEKGKNKVINHILEAFYHVQAARSPFLTVEDVELFIRRLRAALEPLAKLGEKRSQLRDIHPFPRVGREVLRPFFLLENYLDAALGLVPWANRELSSEEAPLTRAFNSEGVSALIRYVIFSMGWGGEAFLRSLARWVLKLSPRELPNLAFLREDARKFVKRLAVAALGAMLTLGEEGATGLIEILDTENGLKYNCPADLGGVFSQGTSCREGVEIYKERVSGLAFDLFRRFQPPDAVDSSNRDWRRAVVIALWMEGELEELLEKALRGDIDLEYLFPRAVEQRVAAMAVWAYNHRDELPLVV